MLFACRSRTNSQLCASAFPLPPSLSQPSSPSVQRSPYSPPSQTVSTTSKLQLLDNHFAHSSLPPISNHSPPILPNQDDQSIADEPEVRFQSLQRWRVESNPRRMEPVSASVPDMGDFGNVGLVNSVANDLEAEEYKHRVDQIYGKVDLLEQRVNEVEQFYANTSKQQPTGSKGSSIVKDKDKERHVPSIRKQQQDAAKRDAAAAKRMQELMRQFGTILRQITQHKWAWPFMQPVDVKGLGLHDYYEVIDKPMDFSTIKNQMEAKDGTGYKNVREICADVRLVFKNAMRYNDERSDVHVMAKTLLAKFEEKWLQLLPKVSEEERRREEEEAEAQLDMQLAQEAAHAKMARDLSNELYELDMHLDELREIVVQKCRKVSTEEKRELGAALTKLSHEDLIKALEIVAQSNPGFQATAEEVDLDIDAQTESTLWRLKFFVKDALEEQGKSAASAGGNNINNTGNANNSNINTKRKREICDAIAKPAKKKNKKPSS